MTGKIATRGVTNINIILSSKSYRLFSACVADGIAPRPRSEHCAWMIGDKMCIFGGVGYETDTEMKMNGWDGEPRWSPLRIIALK